MVDISNAIKNINYELNTILFDWGDTVMKVFPGQEGPMALWQQVAPVDGIEETLTVLQEKYRLVLISNAQNSDLDLVFRALERINLHPYFSEIFTPKEVNNRKPAPGFYLNVLNKLKLDPQKAVMVGDDYEKDIIGAKQVGLWTVWFNAQQKQMNSNFPYHDFEVRNLQDIPQIIETKFGRNM